jgi:hypothetical protein
MGLVGGVFCFVFVVELFSIRQRCVLFPSVVIVDLGSQLRCDARRSVTRARRGTSKFWFTIEQLSFDFNDHTSRPKQHSHVPTDRSTT